MRISEEEFKQLVEAYAHDRPGTVLLLLTQLDDGSVGMVMTPNVGDLIDTAKGGAGLKAAEAYALRAVRAVQEASKESLKKGGSANLILPPSGFRFKK